MVPLKTLKTVKDELQKIIETDLHQKDDRVVKYFRSDGGTEFNNGDVDILLAKHGIVREKTCAGSSHQNGKAERRIRTITERIRTVLSDACEHVTVGFWADAAVYVVYTLNRTPNVEGHSPFFLRYGRKPKLNHLRPFGNPCVVYRKRQIQGKLRDAGVRGNLLGYGYVDGKKGYRVRLAKTNNVVTSGDVSFSVFKSKATGIDLLADDALKADAVVTTPCKPDEVAATINDPLTSAPDPSDAADDGVTSETVTEEDDTSTEVNGTSKDDRFTYTLGAKVAANWRGHGEFYPAIITGVHKAGANGSRTTYDVVYEVDGEPEPNMGTDRLRPHNTADFAFAKHRTGPSGHALMTDCNPQYLADVPDLAREHTTPKLYGQAAKSKQWRTAMGNELDELEKLGVYEFVVTLPNGKTALGCLCC